LEDGYMARALQIQYPGAYYHGTCRGNKNKAMERGTRLRK